MRPHLDSGVFKMARLPQRLHMYLSIASFITLISLVFAMSGFFITCM